MVVAGRPSLSVVSPRRDAALVVRVSTDLQARNPEGSLKNQLQRLRQHISYKRELAGEDWAEVEVYELKGVSGKNSVRSKEFERLFADIRAGRVNTVVCTSIERLCRSLRDFLNLFEFFVENGVEFIALKQQYDTTTPQGKLFITILMALAEFEREQTAERTRDAAAARAERGLWNGGQLLGYDLVADRKGYLVPNPDEAVVVNFAFASYLRSGSIAETADAMNKRGFRTKAYRSRREVEHGPREFSYSTVQHILKNRAYIGKKALLDGKVVQAVWPSIVARETFDRAQQLMARNARANRNVAKTVRHVHILSHGLLRCGRCDSEMQGRSGTGRNGTTYFYYACTNPDCRLRVASPVVEDAVIDRIGALASAPDTVAALTKRANVVLLKERPGIEKRIRTLRRSLKSVSAESGSLARALVKASTDGVVAVNEELASAAQRRREIEGALLEAETRLTELQRAKISAESIRGGLANFNRVFEHLQPHEQRELVRLVLKQAQVGDRELILELYGGALGAFEGQKESEPGVRFAAAPIWLPDLDSNQEHRG